MGFLSSRRTGARTASGPGPDTPAGRRHHLGLRVRSALAWATGALALSVGLSVLAYLLVRSQLVEDRQDRATAQAYVNARAVRNTLRAENADLNAVLGSLGTNARSTTLAWIDGRWYAGSVGTGPDLLPSALQATVAEGEAGSQIASVGGVPYVVVGVPVAEAGARYYELVPLDDVDAALDRLASGMTVAAVLATIAAAVAGWYVSRQVLRPVRTMSAAAGRIADGELDARLDAFGDPELEPLQRSFNEMADKVQERIERERRFTSDVSHELRTPLTAMLSSVQLARRRAHDPVAVEQALDDLQERGDEFRDLVLDLLEISRMDAGVAEMVVEPVSPRALVEAVLASNGDAEVEVSATDRTPSTVSVDKRRMGQVMQNLLENARRYGGGAVRVGLDGRPDGHGDGATADLVLTVDDAGPGIAEHERTHIFNRFARGEAGSSVSEGSGLGLALVAEHVRLHGGTVGVESSPEGGARFRVVLPAAPPEASS